MGVIHPPVSREVPTTFRHREPASTYAFWKNHAKLSVMATPVAHSRTPKTLDDRELARLATTGDGHAFAELYDRHERRVYGFCMRMLGTPHDAADATQETFVRMLGRMPAIEGRELNFVAYALTAARNACYDMIESSKRVEPVAEQPEGSRVGLPGPQDGDLARDPERSALLATVREEVRTANAELPARQREVLALREVELLSYDEIGEIMGLNRNAVAQLVSRARIKLRDLLRGSALASVSSSSPDCERALGLLASIQDDERGSPGEHDWARAHLDACDTCRLSCAAMEEAGVSYRALAPIVPLVWLRHAAIARAAEFVGADWSEIAGLASSAHGPTEGPAEEQSGHLRQTGRSTARAPHLRGRLARGTLAGAALLTLFLVLVAMVGITRDGHVSQQPATGSAPTAHLATTNATPTPRPHPRTTTVNASEHEQTLDRHSSVIASAPRETPVSATPHRTRPARANRHRHRAQAKHRPAPTVGTSQPPSTTSTTPNPPTPTLPPTTTTPPAQTTPAPTPPATGSGESTGTSSTPSTTPEKPGAVGLIP
jgi:RNA polymerase sigma-70 factor (ECF subfamily)